MKIYRDTILKLNERGYLFEDDPELTSIQSGIKPIDSIQAIPQPLEAITLPPDALIQQEILPTETIKTEEPATEGESDSVSIDSLHDVKADEYEPTHKSTSRNRIILPYLRRLFETRKSASVTRKRIENMQPMCEPDEEIKSVFNEKMSELMRVGIEDLFHRRLHRISSKTILICCDITALIWPYPI